MPEPGHAPALDDFYAGGGARGGHPGSTFDPACSGRSWTARLRGTPVRTIGAWVKHVRGWARHLDLTLALLGRPPMSFAVAAGLFVAVLGPSAPVRADPPPDPAAR